MQCKLVLSLFISTCFSITACDYTGGVQNSMKDTPVADSIVEPAVPAVASYYSDTLPCADCQGIVTRIAFNSDSTFMMTELYLGKEKTPQGVLGRWTQENDLVILDAEKESPVRFRIIPKALQKLDKEGKAIDSKNDYTLDEIEKGSMNPREPFTTFGTYYYMADAATFTICGFDKQYPVKQGMASHDAEKLFLDKKNKDLKSIYMEADITIENLPNMEASLQMQIIIHKVRKKLNSEKCP